MKVYLQDDVYVAAKKRVERIFDEFDNIIVSFSGGKDSTVVLELTLEVARERGRLPVKVLFIDQEAEWKHTIDYVREVMYRKEVDPVWIQCPIKLFNAASHDEDWLHCWDESKKDLWIHPQDPISIKENTFGTDRFHKMFAAVASKIFNKQPYANLGGVRTEESPMRFGGVTGARCYKDITWGKVEKHGYTFYPIYDWSFDDVWIYIAKNHLNYNRIYDLMFNYGIPKTNMRVSNLHHETAYRTLFFLQEVERDTYNRLCNRLPGISTFSQLQGKAVFIDKLPEMFTSWKEYRDYLLENLVRPDLQKEFLKRWKGQDDEEFYQEHVTEIMVNDWTGTKNGNFVSRRNLVRKINNGVYTKKYDYKEDGQE